MMPIIYKLITKLLAKHFSPYNVDIVNIQQMGFIHDHHILENISMAWLMQDWVVHHILPTLFLKLDFKKAFNCMDHEYIWDVLTKLGLGGKFLTLVKGLLTHVGSKVHVNGHFT